MSDPTIRLSSCRGDGRCPECGEPTVDLEPAQVCGCSVCFSVGCVAKHSGDLLTEALRQLSDQRERGDQAEAARATQLTESIEALQRVEEERDAAIREKNALIGLHRSGLVCCGGARAEKAERERDEARSEVRTLRLLVESQTEQISRSAMDLYSAVQSEVSAQQRADRAEALLRECDSELTATAGAVADLLCDPAWVVLHNHGWATLKARRNGIEALLAKIREVVR